ncbi:hypothetical protein THASP1DRAFT_27500 [Thamnocephalis sphaerospora]|uniref:Far11/STRP C-terminal domain-containing protein n=1 Tax=Thamnocephalis sphaerospora TaxID=78915 RepID=A0A4P9XXE5_9FUNG|nr:hypothetical protein THASP1DRAFT_27500 [Thamnocephalis sphaerospora]|eukprot:RKP10702.1 hypothetical protein THASP1DRAFT_27500 [Thamnocephalis sphaerospora]
MSRGLSKGVGAIGETGQSTRAPSGALGQPPPQSLPPPPPGKQIALAQLQQYAKQMSTKSKAAAPSLQFEYAPIDTVTHELNEFYSYAESRQWQENYQLFVRDYQKDDRSRRERDADKEAVDDAEEGRGEKASGAGRAVWNELPDERKLKDLSGMLAILDDPTATTHMNTARKLIYIVQGAWHECRTGDQQLQAIRDNNRMLLHLGALHVYVRALERARGMLQEAREMPTATATVVVGAERICVEIELYLTLIYMLIESLRDEGTVIYDTLVDIGAPLAAMLLDTVARLMEKSVKGFPVKKLLLTLWKVMLATLGDWSVAHRIRDAKRTALDLPLTNDPTRPKAYPYDHQYFYEELAVKYPILVPDSTASDRTRYAIAMTASSTGPAAALLRPVRDRKEKHPMRAAMSQETSRSFLFPFTPSADTASTGAGVADEDLLPKALSEAGSVYEDYMYIPLAALQVAEAAEAMDRVDRGLPVTLPGSASMSTKSADGAIPAELLERQRRIQLAIMFLSKVMIATLPNGKATAAKQNSGDSETWRQVNTEELDAARHKEIMWKAVSAILLLMLKHFKACHALMQEHVSQMLVEHNFLPLSLKLLGQQDAVALCRASNEIEQYCFLSHCTRRVKVKPTVTMEPPLPGEPNKQLACWRNCFTVMNFLRVLQSLAKRRAHRILLMLQYKAPAVLKRVLKVAHEAVQRHAYKVCKSFIPYAGQKWWCTVANMRVVTGVYLNCRQDLRDEWLIGNEHEADNDDALAQEQALRALASFYNEHVFLATGNAVVHPRRTSSTADQRALQTTSYIHGQGTSTVPMELADDYEPTPEDIDALLESLDAEFMLEEDPWLAKDSEALDRYERWLDDTLSSEDDAEDLANFQTATSVALASRGYFAEVWPPPTMSAEYDQEEMGALRVPTPAPLPGPVQ